MSRQSAGRAPWPLRRRIVVGVTAVIAVVLLTTGAISGAIVASSVTSVVDSQLGASLSALSHSIEKRGGGKPGGFEKPLVDFVGHAPGTVIALMENGVITDSAEFTEQDAVPCSSAVLDQLAGSVGSGPRIETLQLGDLGEYRVTSHTLANGDVVIAGVSLAVANQAVTQHTILLLIVAALAIAVTIAGVMLVTRFALRPLNRVVDTATAVASLPLHKGDVSISGAIAPFDTDPRTEVGRVGDALRRMIDNVDSALAVREGTDRRMRRFVTDASHELRTPLAAILGYAELTRQENAQLPDLTEYSLARIEAEATRMSSLVSELLLLARLDEGQDLRLDEVELGELVINAVSDARASAPEYEWSAEVPDRPVLVRGDHERLHQVIANLLSNARVHTSAGTRIEARISETVRDGLPVVELSIADNGPGIDPTLMPDLFVRFARGDQSRSRSSGSTGLGLAIVASIVESHDGLVEVESEPGSTVFRVVLPSVEA